ncbi:MAG TPA: TetR/AcrR family transcriptional regulator [Solirubrobacterales bacterium]
MAEGGPALPRGPHNLPRSEILASQRLRLVDAMLREVGARGYEATTVGDVVGRAQVSRNAFYELFDDKQDCFLAACDEVGERTLARVDALASQPSWLDAARVGFDDFLAWWDAQAGLMAAYLVDMPTAGRAALEQRDRQVARFTEIFDSLAARAREEQPELPPLPELAARLLVSAIFELLGQEIRAGRAAKLAELRRPLLDFVVRTLADEETAVRAAGC